MRRRFEDNLQLIDRISQQVCRRNGWFGPDAEDFRSHVHLKLLENDCARLRSFVGRSSFKTYLTAVIVNLFRDERIHRWGKFRPSQAAKREGQVARHLEILLYREGRSFTEAVRILRHNHHVELTEVELAELAGKIPARLPRLREGEDLLEEVPTDGGVEDGVVTRDKARLAAQVKGLVARGLEGLPAEDRLILRMRFEDGFTVARIAQVLSLQQRPLYTRIDRCCRQLRVLMEEEGLSGEEALSLIGWDGGEENE